MMLRQRVTHMWRTGQYIKPADSGFHPRQIYVPGVQGAVYRPRDLSTLFQDAAGTTPVTGMEQYVGRMLDLSGNGNHASQSTSTKRGVVSRRVNLLLGSTTLATQSITTSAAAYELVFSGTGSVTLSGTATGVYGAGTNSITCTAGSLTLTVSGAVQDASFHLATDSRLVYQGVNTATDYDADPNKFPTYIRVDGADDAYQTNSIDFTGTDKMTVWAGVDRLPGSPTGFIVESSASSFTNNGAFALLAHSTLGYEFSSRGTVLTDTTFNSSPPATPSIVAASFDIGGGSVVRRVNSQQSAIAANQGTGQYGNYPLYIGARAGTFLYFTGRLYGLIVAGAQMTPAQLAASKAWMAAEMMLPA